MRDELSKSKGKKSIDRWAYETTFTILLNIKCININVSGPEEIYNVYLDDA